MNGSLPESMAELAELQKANTRFEGFGAETTTILPCPFCGAANWMRFPITAGLDDYKEQQKPHYCQTCKRTARLILTRKPGELAAELVLSGGEDVPDWMNPKPRRV